MERSDAGFISSVWAPPFFVSSTSLSLDESSESERIDVFFFCGLFLECWSSSESESESESNKPNAFPDYTMSNATQTCTIYSYLLFCNEATNDLLLLIFIISKSLIEWDILKEKKKEE